MFQNPLCYATIFNAHDNFEPEAHNKEPHKHNQRGLKVYIKYYDHAQFYHKTILYRYWDFKYIPPNYLE